jgi:DNA polymerase-3 subunit epsilon
MANSLLQTLYEKLFSHRGPPDDPELYRLWKACRVANRRSLMQTPLAHCRFVVMDTETTGFHAYGGDEIVSIALIEYDGLRATGQEYYKLINPQRPIPEQSRKIHGIDDNAVRDAPILKEVLPDIINFMQDSVLIGHHLEFDLRFLNRTIYNWLGCKLGHPAIDTMLMYQTWSGQLGHYELEQVAERCKVPVTERHTALGDARIAAGIFESLAGRLVDKKSPVKSLINQLISED